MLTSDALFGGKLVVFQYEKGYRFSIDAVLLAGLTRVKPRERLIDLGTGCAVVPLIFAHRGLGQYLMGLEIQPELAALAQRNVEANGFSDRIEILETDFRIAASQFQSESFDLVVSNPPYRRMATGRINPHGQRAVARHELTATVDDIFAASAHLLRQGGRLAVVYPSSRLGHLLMVAYEHGFSPKELTIIYSRPLEAARLVHLECRKGGGEELSVIAPFFIYGEQGKYSEPMCRLYE